MSRFWNPEVKDLSPYIPGEQPGSGPGTPIKLNTNEMPFGPSPKVLDALRGATDESLRLYPDPDNSSLREAFADSAGLRASQVFLGNGSDEVLAHSFRALFQPTAPVLFPDITYSFYPVYCRFFGLEAETIPLNQQFEIDLSDYARPNGDIHLAWGRVRVEIWTHKIKGLTESDFVFAAKTQVLSSLTD